MGRFAMIPLSLLTFSSFTLPFAFSYFYRFSMLHLHVFVFCLHLLSLSSILSTHFSVVSIGFIEFRQRLEILQMMKEPPVTYNAGVRDPTPNNESPNPRDPERRLSHHRKGYPRHPRPIAILLLSLPHGQHETNPALTRETGHATRFNQQ